MICYYFLFFLPDKAKAAAIIKKPPTIGIASEDKLVLLTAILGNVVFCGIVLSDVDDKSGVLGVEIVVSKLVEIGITVV